MSPQGYSPNGNYNVQHTPPPNPAVPGQPTDQPMQQPTGEQVLQIKAEGNYGSPSPQWSSHQGGVQGASRPPPSYEDTVKSRSRVSQQSPSSTPPQMWPSGGSQEIPMQYRRNSAPPSQQYSPNGQQPLSPPTPPTQMSPFSGYPSTNPDNWRTQYRNQYGQFQPGPRQDYSQQVPLPPSGLQGLALPTTCRRPHTGASHNQPAPTCHKIRPPATLLTPALCGQTRDQDSDRSKCSQESTSDMFHSAYTVLNDNEDLDEL
ncbi:hypothetical protein Bbelb_006770 [Branchiostoma belcheri]|nr:hypothetical protein Bbelb_006770 [Branchiostoma belcheri]